MACACNRPKNLLPPFLPMACACNRPKNLLPPDIILFEIFLRLRVRTLCKFSCVSKSWSALISDPFFQQSHHQRSKQNPLLFVAMVSKSTRQHRSQTFFLLDKKTRTLDPVTQFTLTERVIDGQMTVLSCTDLVCTYDHRNVYICNPAMRKWITLPNTGSQYACSITGPEDDAIGPPQELAFGCVASSTTPEYKVVRVFATGFVIEPEEKGWSWTLTMFYHGPMNCEVFTLGSKHWRTVQGPPDFILHIGRNVPTIVNGSIHFLAYCSQDLQLPFLQRRKMIATFNLQLEEWSVLPIPQDVDSAYELSLLWEQEGLLFLACQERGCRKLDICVLKQYDNRMWVKEYNIDYTDCMDPNLLTVELLRNYNHTLQEFEEIHAGGENYAASLYVESFKSLNIRGFQQKPVTDQCIANSSKNQFWALDEVDK